MSSAQPVFSYPTKPTTGIPLNTTAVASTKILVQLPEDISAILSTSNAIFVFMALTVFLILCLLLIQVAFFIFTLKTKPPPQLPSKIIIRRKVHSKKSTKTRVSQSAKTEPSKMVFVSIDYDARSEKKEPKKAVVVEDYSKTVSALRTISVDPTQLTASPVSLHRLSSDHLDPSVGIKAAVSTPQALQPKQ